MSDVQAQIREASAQNAELLRAITETDYAHPALQEQNRFLIDLNTQLKASDGKLKSLDLKRKAELKDHEKYRDSHMKRFMFKAAGKKDKFDQRAEKEEREYFDVLQQQHQEKQLNDNLRQQIDEATQAQQQLQAAARRHDDVQRRLDDLYHAIFAGPTPQFPDEDARERDSDAALQAYQATRARAEAEDHVVQLLTQAMRLMNGAIASMDNALGHSRMDMFGGGAMADMMERNALSQAERQMSEARLKHASAQHASADVGALPPVSINHGSLFSDVLFDNIFSDMAFHDEIKRGRAEVVRCAATLDRQGKEAAARREATGRELHQRETELGEARRALQKARELVFERVAKGEVIPPAKQAGGQAGEPAGEHSESSADAPPAYVP